MFVGWTFHISEKLQIEDANSPDNSILYNLFQMRVYDWSGENHYNDQNIQVMCHSTIVASCLYQMICQGELNVSVHDLIVRTTSSGVAVRGLGRLVKRLSVGDAPS